MDHVNRTYKVGDKVRIKQSDEIQDEVGFNKTGMTKWCGQVMTIREILDGVPFYLMEEDTGDWNFNAQPGWLWHSSWFIPFCVEAPVNAHNICSFI